MTEGTKYHPLFEHLLFSGQGQMTMSFAEIESIINTPLPPSARKREEWWSNSPSGHSQARAWLRANYRASEVDLKNERVSFKLEGWPEGYVTSRLSSRFAGVQRGGFDETTQSAFEGPVAPEPAEAAEDHPLFGIWIGKAKLLPGYDYTRPAFEPDATL
jgi:hypothetical protein